MDEVYGEGEKFPFGLPEHGELEQKKRKTEEDKLSLEMMKNPPSSPIPEETY